MSVEICDFKKHSAIRSSYFFRGYHGLMIYVSLGKSHIREQVEKLNAICLIAPPTQETRALPAAFYAN